MRSYKYLACVLARRISRSQMNNKDNGTSFVLDDMKMGFNGKYHVTLLVHEKENGDKAKITFEPIN